MNDTGSDSGLHIDSDWKEEAAREKERLAEREKAGAQSAAAYNSSTIGGPSFLELINILAMQAAIALGGYQGPGGESIPPNHAAAKHHIDLLGLLEEKTKGNLTEEEKSALDRLLYELRMQYVQLTGAGVGPGPQET